MFFQFSSQYLNKLRKNFKNDYNSFYFVNLIK